MPRNWIKDPVPMPTGAAEALDAFLNETAPKPPRVRAKDITQKPWQDSQGNWHFPPPEALEYERKPHHFDETGTARDVNGRQVLIKGEGSGHRIGDDFYYLTEPYKHLPSQQKLYELRFGGGKRKNLDAEGRVRRGRPPLTKEEVAAKFGLTSDGLDEFVMPGPGSEVLMLAMIVSKLRAASKLTQNQFARKTGMTLAKISQAENGVQGLAEDGVEALVRALELDTDMEIKLMAADYLRRQALPKLSMFQAPSAGPNAFREQYALQVAFIVCGLLKLCRLSDGAGEHLVNLKECVLALVEEARETKRQKEGKL